MEDQTKSEVVQTFNVLCVTEHIGDNTDWHRPMTGKATIFASTEIQCGVYLAKTLVRFAPRGGVSVESLLTHARSGLDGKAVVLGFCLGDRRYELYTDTPVPGKTVTSQEIQRLVEAAIRKRKQN